ncbi:MAG TPA: DUF1631 family protein, partial [Xanthomonadaceae bacterium]|nr:DUF1631 family protein [Xanthomonadaceae bacterium]
MHRPQPGSSATGAGEEAIPRLADARLPPRVRSLLEGMLDFAADELERSLVQAVNEFEQQLFKLADQPRNSDGQQSCFETLREVKRGRSDIVPRFMMRLEGALSTLRTPKKRSRAQDSPGDLELSLVDDTDLEVDSVIREISARAEVRNSLALYLMGQRFGVLAGAPAFEPEAIPIGPRGLCDSMREACACLDIPAEHRVLLLRQFDRQVMTPIGPFFEALNNYLVQQRVLPNLHFVPVRVKPRAMDEGPEAAAKKSRRMPLDAVPPPAHAAGSGARADARAVIGGRSPQAGTVRAPGGHRGTGGVRPAPAHPYKPHWPGVPVHQATAATDEDPRDIELFQTMRELMAGRRSVLGKFGKEAGDRYTVSTEDVSSVLGALQHRPVPAVVVGGKVQPRTVTALKQDLMAQLRRVTPEGRLPALTDEDSDTIDLVGMLFDYIVRDLKPTGVAQSLLAKLQAPVLRTALHDRAFFTRRSHPARLLLNSIAETGMYWLDDDEADRGLVEKMQMLVDRVTSDFDGDVGLFDTLLADLSRHMQTLARKAEVAERRHVDAARGRERLELARVHAGEEVAKRLADRRVPKLLAQLLEQTWTDVLALTELRQGVDSVLYRKRLEVAERLVDAFSGRTAGASKKTSAAAADSLRGEVETGLAQVGHHSSDI